MTVLLSLGLFVAHVQLSVAQVAVELGLPAGTVKSRSFYALRKLRDLMTALPAA